MLWSNSPKLGLSNTCLSWSVDPNSPTLSPELDPKTPRDYAQVISISSMQWGFVGLAVASSRTCRLSGRRSGFVCWASGSWVCDGEASSSAGEFGPVGHTRLCVTCPRMRGFHRMILEAEGCTLSLLHRRARVPVVFKTFRS